MCPEHFLFLVSKELMEAEVDKYWALHGILNIWLNLSYAVVLWQGRKLYGVVGKN